MAINPLGINNGTQSFIRFEDDGGTINTQVIDLRQGTVTLTNSIGTTVQFNNGTIDLLKAGTITKLEGGTLGLITRVGNVGTLEVGTISSLPNIPGGTITRVSTLGTLEVGTISALPNTPGGTLGLISAARIVGASGGVMDSVVGAPIPANALAAGINTGGGNLNILGAASLSNTDGNTGNSAIMAANMVSNGTNFERVRVARVAANTIGTGLLGAGVLGQDSGGTYHNIAVTTGNALGTLLVDTVTTVSNLTNGTVRVSVGTISAGTINTGTINVGTFRLNPIPTQVTLSYGTTTTGTIGTLVAAPSAGSAVFITALDMNVQSGIAEPLISFGLATNGQGVVARGNFAAGGGIAKTFPIPNSANNTGTALTFNILSGSGTVSYNVTYFVAVP